MNITTCLFDLDGTLLYTLDDLHQSVNFALSQLGMPLRTLEQTRQSVGRGIRVLIERSMPRTASSSEIEQCLTLFKSHYQLHMDDHTRPYEGIIPLLQYLHEHHYKIGVISNKFDGGAKALIRQFFNPYIAVTYGESHQFKPKPAPDMAFQSLSDLQSTPQETILIGDSEVDFATAQNAHLQFVAATWGYRDEKELRTLGVSSFIHHPLDLIGWLKSNENLG